MKLLVARKDFYDSIRKDFGKLKSSQVIGIDNILNAWEADSTLVDVRHLAYMLATVKHETANTYLAIEEYGKGKGRAYGKPDPVTGFAYYGRGLVQLTWAANYKKMGKILGIDLYRNPRLALDPVYAVDIMFEGMLTRKSFGGDFTGRSLEQYFNKTKNDPIGARRIINGTDKATLIASYHYKFLKALGGQNAIVAKTSMRKRGQEVTGKTRGYERGLKALSHRHSESPKFKLAC